MKFGGYNLKTLFVRIVAVAPGNWLAYRSAKSEFRYSGIAGSIPAATASIPTTPTIPDV